MLGGGYGHRYLRKKIGGDDTIETRKVSPLRGPRNLIFDQIRRFLMLEKNYVSYQCIIPPHMLRNIVEKGSTAQRVRALDSLATSDQLRGQRLAFMAIQPQALAAAEESQ